MSSVLDKLMSCWPG